MRADERSEFVVGLMSGTSADGIDAVAAEVRNTPGEPPARVRAHQHIDFDSELQARILRVCLQGTVSEICSLNFELGEHFARAALLVARAAGLQPEQILAIGSHGQTIHHLPKPPRVSTLQIGEAAVIAERTGITTVSNFRVRDMAAGGQGAPLVPFADWALFTSPTETRVVQNIGGIANLTYLPRSAGIEDVIAFDTGPGNMIMDGLTRRASHGREAYDKDGGRAARGRVHEGLLRELMSHPFLAQLPPKTTGREEFGDTYLEHIHRLAVRLEVAPDDLIATATEFTAAAIVDACERFIFAGLNDEADHKIQFIVGGGGARNPVLMAALKRRLGRSPGRARSPNAPSHIEVLTHEDLGVSSEAKEALAFAILAWRTMQGLPGNVPRATGASAPVILGNITPGRRLQRWPITFSASSSAG